MNIEPLLEASFAIKAHVVTVVPAFVLGTYLLFASEKGSSAHRLIGKIYLVLMTFTAVAATFIRSFSGVSIDVGPFRFGLLHLFVALTAWSVWTAPRAARAGHLDAHRGAMRGLYFGGLIVAGVLAFLPGRVMHRMFLE